MGLKSYRVEWRDNEEDCVEYFGEDKRRATRFARSTARRVGSSAHVVFAIAQTFIPAEARFADQGERVYHPDYPPHTEGNFS